MSELDVRDKVRLLPQQPGVYQFFDANGVIIYVGKAKNLRHRVSSYFAKQHPDAKTNLLVRRIVDLKTIVVDSDYEALLLENSLIKEYQPKYNILLRDDKSFPWIRIHNEHFPRVVAMRNPVEDGSEYIGPFVNVVAMRTLLTLTRELYKLRTCTYDLSPANIAKGKYKKCLEYHIGNCLGPCEGMQREADYDASVAAVRQIVKGRTRSVMDLLRKRMLEHAERLEFEQAEEAKKQVERLENYRARNTVVNPDIGDVDVFGLAEDHASTFVNYMRVIDGAIIHGSTVELKRPIEETPEDILQLAVAELRQRYRSQASEVIVPLEPGIELPGVHFTVPQRGDKKKLLELSERNATYFMLDKRKQETLVDPEAATERLMEQMRKDLRLSEQPRHIECFDNSNTQGTDPVSACVVFKDGKPSKKDYRHFNIRTVDGPDDFATMEEAVERRYSRLLTEGEPLPQLVVIDGGKGQLSSALKVFERLGLRGRIALVGIAKQLEELYFPGDPVPLHIDKRSQTLKVIQHMRNEAHRFGITHHRARRGKRVVRTSLEDIPGIGPATASQLLKTFGSIKAIREVPYDRLVETIGERKAALLKERLGLM